MFSSNRKMNFMLRPASFARWGCVIGRFQPFHLDHLSLVEEAYRFHGRVVVAVTNADPTWQVEVPEAPHRHLDSANPFTFWQRCELIRVALADVVSTESLRIVAFPIHDVSLWPLYLPNDPCEVTCWVRDRGVWEERKVEELRRRYEVTTLPPVVDEVSGTRIRELLAANDPKWRTMVPAPVADLIHQWMLEGSFGPSAFSDFAPGPS
jgi:cytidyltransferase-like protein